MKQNSEGKPFFAYNYFLKSSLNSVWIKFDHVWIKFVCYIFQLHLPIWYREAEEAASSSLNMQQKRKNKTAENA